jgi:hypothetical protein
MWDRSYRWELWARAVAGGLAIVVGLTAIVGFGRTRAANRIAAAGREIGQEVRPDSESLVVAVVPESLRAEPGDLVFLDREDGEYQVVGRVARGRRVSEGQISLEMMLTPAARGLTRSGGVLKGAPATVGLEQAIRLLVTPDVPRDEALRARDAVWPPIQRSVVPRLTTNLVREVKRIAVNLDPGDRQVLSEILQALRAGLAPLEDELAGRLTERAWREIGLSGVAGGIWRETSEDVLNSGKDLRDWLWQRFGADAKDDRIEWEFLSAQRKEALRAAIEEEALIFWSDHREEILQILEEVLKERSGLMAESFRERLAPALYQRAIEPAWLAGEADVIRAVEIYAEDFARRRLLTDRGGPRLLLAHALRSSLKISDAPLLLLRPDDSQGSGKIVYQRLIP